MRRGLIDIMLSELIAETRAERARALEVSWTGPIAYDPLGFFDVFRVLLSSSFSSYSMTLKPWIAIMAFTCLWTLVFKFGLPTGFSLKFSGAELVAGMLGGAISILLAFRLARAAIRFYDARSPTPHFGGK